MEDIRNQFTVDIIERTLHHFYNDVQSQAQANQFLMLAQISPEAWDFAWQLLHPSKSSEVQFFGASTLHVKITKHWNELPYNLYEPLREKLLQALFTHISGPRLILTRLCIAVSFSFSMSNSYFYIFSLCAR
ncbi:importin-13-like, partial [Stegodyphus dumicola]|uniref:importin-13-like n=1 Tax=Stegodyphus dumicola TaxID=202533 RepID=UPI0015A9DCB8